MTSQDAAEIVASSRTGELTVRRHDNGIGFSLEQRLFLLRRDAIVLEVPNGLRRRISRPAALAGCLDEWFPCFFGGSGNLPKVGVGHRWRARHPGVGRQHLSLDFIHFEHAPHGLHADPQTRSHIWSYISELKSRESITIFLTTHYMDEAEYCDRIAIIDNGELVAMNTPEALKQTVGKDRVAIQTDDDESAIGLLAERFGLDATVSEGRVTFYVPHGEEFVPRLFTESGVRIGAVSVARPTLDDVFMSYTGRTIRDAEASGTERNRSSPWTRMGRGR